MGRGETNAKKRKRKSEAKGEPNGNSISNGLVDTSKPTAVFKPTKGRNWTISVALPGSIIANAQTHELRTILAGQIARALSVFCVDEVVIFNDCDSRRQPQPRLHSQHGSASNLRPQDHDEYTGILDPDHFLVHLLSYLETPPHLRKLLFPLHPNLRTAGALPSLDLPHHLRADEWCQYREGVALAPPPSTSSSPHSPSMSTTFVEAGLSIPVTVSAAIPASTRVTLRFSPLASDAPPNMQGDITAEAVDPAEPRIRGGYYWGYAVRRASSLSAVFEECPFAGGYDVTIGTSERGTPLDSLSSQPPSHPNSSPPLPTTDNRDTADAGAGIAPFQHLLLALGGLAGLEAAAANDATLRALGVDSASTLFDHWLNILPGQGSRTIRTEEALWIALMGIRGAVVRNAAAVAEE